MNENEFIQTKIKIFISYSHHDSEWLFKLKRHFKLLEDKVEFWDDTKIEPGENWKNEINLALENCDIAILLISADFLNSDFILNNELPPLLAKAKQEGMAILSLILKPSLYELHPKLSKFQALNSPNKSMITLSEADQEMVYVKLMKFINSQVPKY